jgi:hypothetical protein
LIRLIKFNPHCTKGSISSVVTNLAIFVFTKFLVHQQSSQD